MVTSAEMTSTTEANKLPDIWASDTKDAIMYKEVLAALVTTKYEAQMRVGRTFEIPHNANLTTQTKTEGISNTINYEAITATKQTVTVSTYQYAAQLLNVVAEVQSNYDERRRISQAIGYALARGIEVSIANLFGSLSQIVGSLGADPDDAVLRRAWQYLADAGVEDNACWVWGPAAVAALFGNDKFTSTDYVSGKSAIESAKLPSTLYSYPSYTSNLLTNPAAGQTNCALFHKEQFSLLRQIKPTVKTHYDMNTNADGVLGYDLYTADELEWVAETPGSLTTGDYGGVLIRSA